MARRLWLTCLREGRLQPDVLREVVAAVARHPERGGMGVLAALAERLRRYEALHRAVVESAVPLEPAVQRAVAEQLAAWHLGGVDSVEFAVTPELLGGLRVRAGYGEFDASVRGRLQRLRRAVLRGGASASDQAEPMGGRP